MNRRATVPFEAPRNVVLAGDVRKVLADLPAESIDSVVTSPPYFQLRDYGMSKQMGLESTVDEWVDELRLVMGGIARVLAEPLRHVLSSSALRRSGQESAART
jgi:DNA modification methylase